VPSPIFLVQALSGALRAHPLPERATYALHTHKDPRAVREPAILQARLLATLAQHHLINPWSLSSPHTLSLSALAAALVSPVDHHTAPLPRDYLPIEQLPRLQAALTARATATDSALDVCEQLEVSLTLSGSRPLQAALALHCLTRVLARGQDRRLGPQTRLWLDERLAQGAILSGFAPALSGRGDRLGDLRAYWGACSAGLAATWAKQSGRRSAGRALQGLFYFGPTTGGALRAGLGRASPFGDHATVARIGLRHGLALGVATQRQLRAVAPTNRPTPPRPSAAEPAPVSPIA
jgi:hypothetical protein